MKLSQYLETADKNATEFALLIGCDTSTITRILRGERGPSVHLAVKIEEATGGQVTPRDFVPSQAAPESAA